MNKYRVFHSRIKIGTLLSNASTLGVQAQDLPDLFMGVEQKDELCSGSYFGFLFHSPQEMNEFFIDATIEMSRIYPDAFACGFVQCGLTSVANEPDSGSRQLWEGEGRFAY